MDDELKFNNFANAVKNKCSSEYVPLSILIECFESKKSVEDSVKLIDDIYCNEEE